MEVVVVLNMVLCRPQFQEMFDITDVEDIMIPYCAALAMRAIRKEGLFSL